MKIAYISYEHPLGIAGGGIGTYIGQIASLMAKRGHEVEVFSGHLHLTESKVIEGYHLHLIKSNSTNNFRELVLDKFSIRHDKILFEIIESPEYGADALLIKIKYPNLPLVVKLHTPSFLVSTLNSYGLTFLKKLRYLIGGILRGQTAKRYWIYDKESDDEYQLFKLANTVCSPSNSLKQIVNKTWGDKPISVIPNLFIPSFDLSPVNKNKSTFTVTFIGKLERRKGILDLVNAIPIILKKDPEIKFVFVGMPNDSPIKGIKMDAYINKKLKTHINQIEFKGFVSYHEMEKVFNRSNVCIFPSLWENFPTVCLEAMSAGIPVIGTNSGGMSDIIENKKNGILINPNSPREICQSVLLLKKDTRLLTQIALNGHQHILKTYNGEIMGKTIENFYTKTMNTL